MTVTHFSGLGTLLIPVVSIVFNGLMVTFLVNLKSSFI